VKDLNATRAAIRASYSKRSARNQGQCMMTNDDVRAEIDRAIEERIERTLIEVDAVLEVLVRLGFSYLAAFVVVGVYQ
jgi:phage terminase small subunit